MGLAYRQFGRELKWDLMSCDFEGDYYIEYEYNNYTKTIIRLHSVNKVMVGLRYEFGKL